jgi:hypothetical protein
VSEGYASVTVFSSNVFRMSVFIGVDCSMDFRMSVYVIVFGPLEMSAYPIVCPAGAMSWVVTSSVRRKNTIGVSCIVDAGVASFVAIFLRGAILNYIRVNHQNE